MTAARHGRLGTRGVRALLLGAGLVVLTSVILVLGAITPRLLISDGLANLQEETRLVGRTALEDAWLLSEMPTRQLQVVQVDPVPACYARWSSDRVGYRVLIQRYTFFGIPAGVISVCGDTVAVGLSP